MTTRAMLALGAVWVIWGSTYLGIKAAVVALPPLVLSGGRYIVAGTLLTTWVVLSGELRRHRPERRQIATAAALGFALVTVGNGAMSWLGTLVPSGLLALLTCFTPIFMVVGDRVVSGQPMGRARAIGLVLGLAGSLWLVMPGERLRVPWWPLTVLVLSTLVWTAASLWARRAALPRSQPVSTAIQMLAGGVFGLVGATVRGEWAALDLARVPASAWAAFAYLALFGSLVAFTAYAWLLKNVPMHVVSTHNFVNPVVAVLLGAAVLGEPLEPSMLGAGATVVVAVALIFAPRRA